MPTRACARARGVFVTRPVHTAPPLGPGSLLFPQTLFQIDTAVCQSIYYLPGHLLTLVEDTLHQRAEGIKRTATKGRKEGPPKDRGEGRKGCRSVSACQTALSSKGSIATTACF